MAPCLPIVTLSGGMIQISVVATDSPAKLLLVDMGGRKAMAHTWASSMPGSRMFTSNAVEYVTRSSRRKISDCLWNPPPPRNDDHYQMLGNTSIFT